MAPWIRLHRLERAVDTIAIEVERISEAQRFMLGLLSESGCFLGSAGVAAMTWPPSRRIQRGIATSPIKNPINPIAR